MKLDIKGVSQCPEGQENYEKFTATDKKCYFQYDYRTQKGTLFSCIAPTLEKCRAKKNLWLKYNIKKENN